MDDSCVGGARPDIAPGWNPGLGGRPQVRMQRTCALREVTVVRPDRTFENLHLSVEILQD